MMKKFIIIFLSGITAIIILNALFFFYYRQPVQVANPDKSTDFIYESNSTWIRMIEGISWGKMDASGYNNKEVVKNPNILMLGSSQMEAINVCQNCNTVYYLKQNLNSAGLLFSVYNKGVSGNFFLNCVDTLSKNTDTSASYIVMETSKIDYTGEEISDMLNGKIEHRVPDNSGIRYFCKKLPFVNLLYYQYIHGLPNLFLIKKKIVENDTVLIKESTEEIQENYDKLFNYISNSLSGKQIIIFYHPIGLPKESGDLDYKIAESYYSEFANAAEKYGIAFIDLTEETEKLWHTEHKTTHGFTTGTAFGGHLNKNGHKIAARKIADYIIQNEEKKDVAF